MYNDTNNNSGDPDVLLPHQGNYHFIIICHLLLFIDMYLLFITIYYYLLLLLCITIYYLFTVYLSCPTKEIPMSQLHIVRLWARSVTYCHIHTYIYERCI